MSREIHYEEQLEKADRISASDQFFYKAIMTEGFFSYLPSDQQDTRVLNPAETTIEFDDVIIEDADQNFYHTIRRLCVAAKSEPLKVREILNQLVKSVDELVEARCATAAEDEHGA